MAASQSLRLMVPIVEPQTAGCGGALDNAARDDSAAWIEESLGEAAGEGRATTLIKARMEIWKKTRQTSTSANILNDFGLKFTNRLRNVDDHGTHG